MSLERRTPLRRTGGPKANPEATRAWQDRSRKPLPAASPKGRARAREAAEAGQRAKARDGHRCIARALVPEVKCWGPLDPQHVIPRSTAPELATDEDNIIGCCRAHHRYIDDHPKRARELGLHGHAGDDLEELRLRRLRAAGREPGLVRDALPTVEEDRQS